ncbi:MAG: hypothetical protein ABIG70_01800 [Pseudomonadota bacterium]
MDKQQMIDLASNPDATAEQLAQLVNKHTEVNRLLAEHPHTQSEILDEISWFRDEHTSQYDAESRRNVVRNPNVANRPQFILGGYSDGLGNTWHEDSGHMLLFHSIDHGVKITNAVYFEKRRRACNFTMIRDFDR